MNDPKIIEANRLLQEARESESKAGGFFTKFLGGASGKLEEAACNYTKAGNQFKASKQWDRAGAAFKQASRLQKSNDLNQKHEAANSLVNAGQCLKKSNTKTAIDAYTDAVELLVGMGRFNMAAKHLASCGDIHKESRDFKKAVECYQQSADYYRSEDSLTTADKQSLLAADILAADMEMYTPACEIYELVGGRSADNNLLKYSAKNYFFKAALCHLIIDVINVQQALERYNKLLPSFQDSREYNLLTSLIKATEEVKIDDFTDAVKQYDTISRLDDWTTHMLLQAKKNVDDDDVEIL